MYEEVSNAPASLATARCCLAVSIIMQLVVTFRYVQRAYLQAGVDAPHRIPTLVELPRDWWPQSWFFDKERQLPRYIRPLVTLRCALYGHPEAGFLWDEKFASISTMMMWEVIEGWNGVFVHPDGSIIILYVDDVLLASTQELMYVHWRDLATHVGFKDEPQPIL